MVSVQCVLHVMAKMSVRAACDGECAVCATCDGEVVGLCCM